MATHVPGPWHVRALTRRKVLTIESDTYGLVAQVEPAGVKGNPYTPGVCQANATLIAAAPELLDALHDLCALYEASPGRDPHFVAKACAAIAKAKKGGPT